MSEVKKMSRAQKRRAQKRAEEAAADGNAGVKVDETTPPGQGKAITPEKAKAITPEKQVTPEKGSAAEKAQLEVAFADLKIGDDEEYFKPLGAEEVCSRMAVGTGGKPCNLTTNTFELRFGPPVVYRYVVEFEPEIPPERIKLRRITMGKFRQELRDQYGETFFDGTTMLNLKQAGNANFGPSADGTSIHVRFTRSIDTTNPNVQEVNMIVNVMTKKLLRRQKMILMGRSYFYPEPKSLVVQYHSSTPQAERHRLKLFQGFNVSVQPCLMGNLMTVDLVSRVMQEVNVRTIMNNIMRDCKNAGKGREDFQFQAKSVLVGSTVMCTYNNRPWRIDDIDFTKTMNSTFTIEVDPKAKGPRGNLGEFVGDISFREYFSRRYPEIVQGNKLPPANHPACTVPGLLVNTPRKERTTKQQTILLPELCFLTGLNDKMRSNQSLMKALNAETRLAPSRRVKAISDLVAKVHARAAEADAKDGALPVQLARDPVVVTGRVLPSFSIQTPQRQVTISGSGFQKDIFKCGFFNGRAQCGDWGMVFVSNDARTASQAASTMRESATSQGANFGKCFPVEIKGNQKDAKQWQNAIDHVLAQSTNVQFFVFLIPNADSFIYSVVKNHCTVLRAKVSQCILPDNISKNPKMLRPIMNNSTKQLVAKLGFQNWRINIGQHLGAGMASSTMMVGVDVSHDKLLKGVYGGSRDRRSTVGFTATRDASFHAFNSYISYQSPDTEYLTEGQRLMKGALVDYQKENKKYPNNVLVYRDGVGDSQLTTFVRSEIKLYEAAFNELGINPKLTVIVVQKRVNLRLFTRCPLNAKAASKCNVESRCNGRDPYHSPMAGTCVDDKITSSMMSDFYLVPSIAPPGATARPTRFIVLKDGMLLGSNPSKLQNMTNQMCYMYYNWPGPIRVPAVVMYAHKAAFLFGKNVTGNPHADIKGRLHFL